MGFYNSKLNNYLKTINFSTEQLETTKNRIIEQKKNNIEQIKNDIRISRKLMMEGYDSSDYDEDRNAYFLATKELEFLSTMSTPEFYQYLISLENYNLSKIEEKAFDDMTNCITTISKQKSQKGLIGATSRLLGINKKIIEKNGKMFDLENFSADFAQSSRQEWQSISPENQALYIVGRFEIDKCTGFDKKGYNNYRLKAYENSLPSQEENLGIEK